MTAVTSTAVSIHTATRTDVLPALSSIAAGILLIFAVGFSHMSVAHNAAHDTRHTAAFPCH
ncbi:MAG: CbtB domain-containing protein [Pseudomonadales bacterium]|jgi:cobalt transporter subunit CbtB|nr:CbtB domain-containing protein [Pseudomonadales bacterium]